LKLKNKNNIKKGKVLANEGKPEQGRAAENI